jgi:hypothetical protein
MSEQATPQRMIASAVAVVLFCVLVWFVIQKRSQPPPPPVRANLEVPAKAGN